MRTFRVAVLLATVAFLASASAWAQSAAAAILGQVTDAQGAAVPAVNITVSNTATQVTYKTVTDSSGNYRVLALPIGTYTVTAEHEGFSKLVTEPRTLEINQQERMDLRLNVGARSETVEVTGVGANVETVNPTLGQSITSRTINNLPLNGRNVLTLALLQPGVTDDNPDDTSAGSASLGGANFSVAGGRADSTTYLLDGGVNNELLGNGVVYNPNPDSVAEFRILTSNYTSEYGRNGAGVISVVTKSGSNDIHGSLFEFVRNTAFDANAYFNIPQGIPRNDLKRNQFGGTFGGPIIKNKFFFFASYQGQRQVQTEVEGEQTTFTPAELKGDFSQTIAGSASPNVADFLQANPYFQSDSSLAAQGIIDPTKIDPAAQQFIAAGYIPTSPTGTLFPAGSGTNNTNELTGKLDFNITTKDKLSATVGGIRNPLLQPFGPPPIGGYGADVPGFSNVNQANNYFLNISYTRTISTNLLNELRGTAQRHYTVGNKPVATLPTAASLGFGLLSDAPNGPPLISFDNGLAVGPDQAGPSLEGGNTFAISNVLTWVRGHNTWKYGAGFSAYQQNTTYNFFGDGNFDFIGSYAQGGIGTGNSLADFLVGIPNNLFEGPDARNNIRSKATFAFLQDEWHATSRLVLTLGVRYEYSTPKSDTAGRTFSIIPGDQSTRFPNAPLGLVFPGDRGAPTGSNFPDKNDFAPRFGFAWDPTGKGKTSVRGGIGLFYDVLKGEDNLQFNGAPPFYSEPIVSYSCPATAASGVCQYPFGPAPFYTNPWTTAGLPGNPFPSPIPTASTAFANGADIPFGGGSIFFVNPHLHTPYIYQYNLSVQHEIAPSITLETNYVGSSSKGLTSLFDRNPFILSTVSGPNPTRILNQNQSAALTSYCALQAQGASDCPFASALEFGNVSFANYNSLEVSLTKQVSDSRFGTSYFTFAYTYGHSIDDSSGFRNRDSQVPYYNVSQFRASSDFDVTHRIILSGGWDLPFDKWGGPKRLVKGWSLYPIFSWRNGFPLSVNSGFSIYNYSDPGPSGAGDAYLANAVFAPGVSNLTLMNPKNPNTSCFNPFSGNPNPEVGNLYFSCDAFQPIADTVGAGYGLPRDFFRGPGRINLDMALAKTTAITERVNAEFRVEAFNVLNHPEFANPDTNLNSSSFGQITSTTFGEGVTALQTQRILQLALRVSF
jgi:Carboxypeptidase regulatory-like domain